MADPTSFPKLICSTQYAQMTYFGMKIAFPNPIYFLPSSLFCFSKPFIHIPLPKAHQLFLVAVFEGVLS